MAENQPKPLMLMFTIGPVQSFIEAARKTEDLWMGSYILSYLVATAMENVQRDGVEIIYPAIGEQSSFEFWRKQVPTTPSFPNLFLAIGDSEKISQNVLGDCAATAEIAVNTEFESMAKRVLDKAFRSSGPWRHTYVEKLYRKQISNFFDVYWVITEKTGPNYGAWYDYTASRLAAIKNCRVFKQINEFGRKCSLDGTREILHPKEGESVEQAMKWWEEFSKNTPKYCREKEALCAVSLTKRMGMHFLEEYSKFSNEFSEECPKFPSTSEVATADFKERLLCKPCTLGDYQDFCQLVRDLRESGDENVRIPTVDPLPKIRTIPNNVDGEWLYEETWTDSYLLRYYGIDASKKADQIERCKELRGKITQSLGGEPGKYYAVIALDADNMGEVNRKAEDKEKHKDHSQQLIEYTKDARAIVEDKHLGKLTYAGGDDLLALANLKDLLPILKKLRKKFPKFTSASAGVCIAHNKIPLGDVLQHARRMEIAAKNIDKDKDALGIVLFKRSGNVSEMVTKWKYDNLEILAISSKLINLLRYDEVSKRFLYNFRETFTKLVEGKDNFPMELEQVIGSEFMRIMKSAHSDKGTQGEVSQQIVKSVTKLIYCFQSFSDFLGYLEIVSFVARESK